MSNSIRDEWQSDDGSVRLLLGDCLEILPTLESESIDAVITDPPYGTTACKWDVIIPLEPMWKQINRITKPNSAFVFCTGQPFTSVLICSNLAMFKYCWVWDKILPVGFQVAKYKPMMRHEDVCVFGNGSGEYRPIMSSRKKAIHGYATGSQSSPLAKCDSQYRTYTDKHPQSIIPIQRPKREGSVHPTEKPVLLLEYFIETYSDEQNLICDFAFGSGTTGVACIHTGRRFIGIDLEREYWQTAVNRCKKEIKLDKSSFQIRPKPGPAPVGFFEKSK